MKLADDVREVLSTDDMYHALRFLQLWVDCCEESVFHEGILEFSEFLGFEFVLCGYTDEGYSPDRRIHLTNLTNPEAWMAEYAERDFLRYDPVRIEMERRLEAGERSSFIYWDAYQRDLSPEEREVITRRTHYGLRGGCSVYMSSRRKDAAFLLSLASATQRPSRRVEVLCQMVVPHLNATRKRLGLLTRIGSLSPRESVVASWVAEGKTNGEIADILSVSESTVKFHFTNIMTKLRVSNRHEAISLLLAERYLAD